MKKNDETLYVPLKGSEKPTLREAQIDTTTSNEVVDVTIRIQRKSSIEKALGEGKLLSREEYANEFGASDEDISAVEDFANKHHLTVVESNKALRSVIVYLKQTAGFIKFITGSSETNTPFILVDKTFQFERYDCLKYVISDTAAFTKEERTYIESESRHSLLRCWTTGLVLQAKIISVDTVHAIFEDRSKGWKYFYKNAGVSFSNFSASVFLRNYSYCLFYSDNSCGGLCGRGRLTLYKKEGESWKEIKSYCDWIS